MKSSLLILSLCVLNLVSAESARADAQIFSNFTGNRMCVAINDASLAAGAAIVESDCSDRFNQLFRFIDKDGGYVQIQSARSGQCLDLPAGTMNNGEVYQQWGCGAGNTAPNQEFAMQTTEGGFTLQNRYSGKCLAIPPHSPFANNVPLIQEPCTLLPEEVFHLGDAGVAPTPPVSGLAPWVCTARNARGLTFEGFGQGIDAARADALAVCKSSSRVCTLVEGSCHVR